MSCIDVDHHSQAILDALASADPKVRSTEALASSGGVTLEGAHRMLTELSAIGWVFGGPDHWELTGVGHIHTTSSRRGGILGDDSR